MRVEESALSLASPFSGSFRQRFAHGESGETSRPKARPAKSRAEAKKRAFVILVEKSRRALDNNGGCNLRAVVSSKLQTNGEASGGEKNESKQTTVGFFSVILSSGFKARTLSVTWTCNEAQRP